MDIRLNFFEPFRDVYGFIASGDVLRFTAMLLGEVMDQLGSNTDFIGHAGGDNFVIVTSEGKAEAIKTRLKERFAAEVQTHYSFMDRQQGYIIAPDETGKMGQTPLMTLAIGVISPTTHFASDIREITELAAEERRLDSSKG
jgi:GGDEF domain-containing protein